MTVYEYMATEVLPSEQLSALPLADTDEVRLAYIAYTPPEEVQGDIRHAKRTYSAAQRFVSESKTNYEWYMRNRADRQFMRRTVEINPSGFVITLPAPADSGDTTTTHTQTSDATEVARRILGSPQAIGSMADFLNFRRQQQGVIKKIPALAAQQEAAEKMRKAVSGLSARQRWLRVAAGTIIGGMAAIMPVHFFDQQVSYTTKQARLEHHSEAGALKDDIPADLLSAAVVGMIAGLYSQRRAGSYAQKKAKNSMPQGPSSPNEPTYPFLFLGSDLIKTITIAGIQQ